MTCTVHHIRGDRQTGKTTLALGFLERLERTTGEPCGLYVGYSRRNAEHHCRHTSVACVGLPDLSVSTVANRTAIAVDDCDHMDLQHAGRVVWAWRLLCEVDSPTQLVLVNWVGDFPPKWVA